MFNSEKQTTNYQENVTDFENRHYELPEVQQNQSISIKERQLLTLEEKNRKLMNQIKKISKDLDKQIQKIKKKGFINFNNSKNIKRNPRIQSIRCPEMQQVYEQHEKVKRKLENKKHSEEKILFFQDKYRNLLSEYQQKEKQLIRKQHTFQQLSKKMKKQKQPANQTNFKLSNFETVISQLREQIKSENQRIKNQQKQFLSNNPRKNYAQKSPRHKKSRNKSQLLHQSSLDSHSLENEEEFKQLKDEYESLGKRIEKLKSRKLSLVLDNGEELTEKRKRFYQLKIKLEELCKLTK